MAIETTGTIPTPPIEISPTERSLTFREQQAISRYLVHGPQGARVVGFPHLWREAIQNKPDATREEFWHTLQAGVVVTLKNFGIDLKDRHQRAPGAYKDALDKLLKTIIKQNQPVHTGEQEPGQGRPSDNLVWYLNLSLIPTTRSERRKTPPYTLLRRLAPVAELASLAGQHEDARGVYQRILDYNSTFQYQQPVLRVWVREWVEQKMEEINDIIARMKTLSGTSRVPAA